MSEKLSATELEFLHRQLNPAKLQFDQLLNEVFVPFKRSKISQILISSEFQRLNRASSHLFDPSASQVHTPSTSHPSYPYTLQGNKRAIALYIFATYICSKPKLEYADICIILGGVCGPLSIKKASKWFERRSLKRSDGTFFGNFWLPQKHLIKQLPGVERELREFVQSKLSLVKVIAKGSALWARMRDLSTESTSRESDWLLSKLAGFQRTLAQRKKNVDIDLQKDEKLPISLLESDPHLSLEQEVEWLSRKPSYPWLSYPVPEVNLHREKPEGPPSSPAKPLWISLNPPTKKIPISFKPLSSSKRVNIAIGGSERILMDIKSRLQPLIAQPSASSFGKFKFVRVEDDGQVTERRGIWTTKAPRFLSLEPDTQVEEGIDYDINSEEELAALDADSCATDEDVSSSSFESQPDEFLEPDQTQNPLLPNQELEISPILIEFYQDPVQREKFTGIWIAKPNSKGQKTTRKTKSKRNMLTQKKPPNEADSQLNSSFTAAIYH